VVKARIYMVSLLDFINSISQTDDIQDVSARTVAGKVGLLAPGGGGGPDRKIVFIVRHIVVAANISQ